MPGRNPPPDAALPPAGPWPITAAFGSGGLGVAGVAAAELAGEHGTPLLVVDEDHVRRRCRTFAGAFPRALYAVKAFTSRRLVRIAQEEGMGLLVASGGELAACLRAGADPARIAFHGNNKSDEELELAVATGIDLVIADNASELARLDAIASGTGRRQAVLFRVIPGVSAGTHSFVETGELDSKFGTPIPGGLALRAVAQAALAPALELRGIHAHVGSQIVRAEPFLSAVDVLLDFMAEVRAELGVELPVLDLGGGFGAVYTDERPPDVEEVAAAMLDRVAEGCRRRGLPVPEVVVEPGRAVVANAVLTLYRVGSVKEIPGVRNFVAVDGGMSDNIRPVLYGARYTVAVAHPVRRGAPRTVTVVGKHCESGDVLARDVDLPDDLAPGDLLAFAATGAYGYSMASNYNRLGRPAVVGVRDGRAEVWLRRERPEDLDRLEVDPEGDGSARPAGLTSRAEGGSIPPQSDTEPGRRTAGGPGATSSREAEGRAL
ncbi:MAG: diaminopimelate decarboxylase [Actinobacteria bacterium]|nr:diaminopimelate decarboxylase [Actinomycetota bacterium]